MPNPRKIALFRDSARSYGLSVTNSDRQYFEGNRNIELDNIPSHIWVPCRRCPACLKLRAAEWQGRLIREYEYHHKLGCKTLFLTLTYEDKYISNAHNTYSSDIATFFDSLRSKFRRSIRHFVIAELGDEKGRFHVHCLLFDAPGILCPHRHLKRTKLGILHGSNDILKARWKKGIVDCSWVQGAKGAAYVAKYVGKQKPNEFNRHFKSTIYASNGLGYIDISQYEVDSIRNACLRGDIPFYYAGGRQFSYPYSVLKKYCSNFERMCLSCTVSTQVGNLGGSFVFQDRRFRSFADYDNIVKSYLSSLDMFDIIKKNNNFDWNLEYNIPPYNPDLVPF